MLVQPALLPLVQLDLDSVAEPQLSQSPISNLQSPSPSPPQATRTKYQAPRMKPAHLLPQMTRNPRSHHKMRHPTPPLREPAHLRPTPLPGTKPSMRQMPPSPPQARRTWSPPPTPPVTEQSIPIAGPVDLGGSPTQYDLAPMRPGPSLSGRFSSPVTLSLGPYRRVARFQLARGVSRDLAHAIAIRPPFFWI